MNLIAYSAQIGILVIAGAALPRLFRMRSPGPMLIYWQCLLALCVLLPLFEGKQPAPGRKPGTLYGYSSVGAHRRTTRPVYPHD